MSDDDIYASGPGLDWSVNCCDVRMWVLLLSELWRRANARNVSQHTLYGVQHIHINLTLIHCMRTRSWQGQLHIIHFYCYVVSALNSKHNANKGVLRNQKCLTKYITLLLETAQWKIHSLQNNFTTDLIFFPCSCLYIWKINQIASHSKVD